MGFNLFDFRFKHVLARSRIRVLYAVGMVLIPLLALFFIVPEGFMDEDTGAVVFGFLIAIVGPITLGVLCAAGTLVYRIDKNLRALAPLEGSESRNPAASLEVADTGFNGLEYRAGRFLNRVIRVCYVVVVTLIGLLAFALVVPGGILDGDNEAVALGLVFAILGPISLRIMCEAGVIVARADEGFEVLAKLERRDSEHPVPL